jgi:predicted dinucleotide-binding enzyme
VDARRVAILGAGTIGEALLRGLLSGGWREAGEIVATVRDEERARELEERHGVQVTLSNTEAVAGATLVVIAVKPQDFDTLLGEIGGVLTPEQTVLSVAAAISSASSCTTPSRTSCGSDSATTISLAKPGNTGRWCCRGPMSRPIWRIRSMVSTWSCTKSRTSSTCATVR